MIIDDLDKKPISTIPNDLTDPPRFGQPVETTKDAFVIELRKFFNRTYQSAGKLEELPNIRKFDLSFNPNETSLETAVNLIQKFPGINEHLPLIAVLGATGRTIQMGIGTTFVDTVHNKPTVIGSNIEPFALQNGQTIIYKTKGTDNIEHTSTIMLRASRFNNIAQATAEEVAYEINFQSLYGSAYATSDHKISVCYGGALSTGVSGDIEIIGGTAITALGLTIGQKATYLDIIPYHRYCQAVSLEIAIEVVAEDHNVRTEVADLIWNFFSFQMDSRDYMFVGRSSFDDSVPNETYQIIIKPDIPMSGEQEVPRPGDEKDKLYVNRINVSVTTIQFVDRAVLVPGTTTPLYITKDSIAVDQTIPFKN